jgi:hypothetical protein
MTTNLISTAASLILALSLQAQTVSNFFYLESFEGPVGREWSARATTLYPYGSFVGELAGNDVAMLTLSNLPPHTNLVVAFDLLILKRWHGNNTANGFATWELRVTGQAAPLLRTTFSNDSDYKQSFPNNYQAVNNARTGAAETNTLGFRRDGGDIIRDSVYKLLFRIPHSNDTVQLQFVGTGLEAATNQSWGLDNVFVGTNDLLVAPLPTTNDTVLVESSFDAGQDGWSDWDANGKSAPITYHPTNGISGGYLSLDEVGNGDGATTYWVAPAKFLGDQRPAFGGAIEFTAKQSSRDSQSGVVNNKCVVLVGGGLTLNYTSPYRPCDAWTHFAVPLLPAFWQVDDGSGRAPTLEEMLLVLGNLTTLRVRAEYRAGNDVDSIDSVRLLAGRPDGLSPLFIRAAPNGMVAVHWPASRSALKLQSTSAIAGTYTDVSPVSETPTNGLHSILIPANESAAFFRLVKAP